jgi:hypothetical protein
MGIFIPLGHFLQLKYLKSSLWLGQKKRGRSVGANCADEKSGPSVIGVIKLRLKNYF